MLWDQANILLLLKRSPTNFSVGRVQPQHVFLILQWHFRTCFIILSIIISWDSTARKRGPFLSFIYSNQDGVRNIYSLGYDPVLSLFMLSLKVSRSPHRKLPSSWLKPHHFLEYFLTFWHHEVLQAPFIFYLRSLVIFFLFVCSFLFLWKWRLETKIRTLSVLVVRGCHRF